MYDGQLYQADGDKYRVRVVADAEGLVMESPEGREHWTYSSLNMEWTGSENRMVAIHHGQDCLYVNDPDLLNLMSPHLTSAQQSVIGKILKQSKKKGVVKGLMALLLATLLLLGAIACGLFRVALWGRDTAIAKIPVTWEQELGKQAYASMLEDTPACDSKALSTGIKTLEAKLEKSLQGTPYNLEYQVLKSQQVNAFALPGGNIGLNAELVAKAPSAEALMGVMAHEAQHVLQRHGLKGVINQLGVTLMIPLVFGDMGSVMIAVAGAGASLINLGFSRGQESEADALGVNLLDQAGVDPRGMEQFFKWMSAEEAKKGSVPAFLSTHPLSSEREAAIHTAIGKLPKKTYAPVDVNWPQLQAEARKCAGANKAGGS